MHIRALQSINLSLSLSFFLVNTNSYSSSPIEPGLHRDGGRDQNSSGGVDSNSDLKNGDSSENPASNSNNSGVGDKSGTAASSRATPGGVGGGAAQNGAGVIGGNAKQAEQDPDDAMAKFLWKSSSSKKPPMVMFQVRRGKI